MDASTQDLQEKRDRLLLEADIQQIEQALKTASIPEAFGDWVDTKDHIYDTPGFETRDGRISLAHDRDHGDNRPFWTSEQEHAETRGIARFLATTDEVAISALENLTNYVVGTGFEYKAEPRLNGSEQIAACCDAEFDLFDEANDWRGDLERELFMRTRRDGESKLWLYNDAERGGCTAEVVEPEFITEPDKPRELEDWKELPYCDWKYGIATEYNRPSRRRAYFVEWYGKSQEWDVLLEKDIVSSSINVDRNIKRGLSDFYAVYLQLERASKLLGNTLQGAAIQATIAYIRKHAAGTSAAQIQSLAGGDYSYQRPTKDSSVTHKVKKFLPGTVIDTAGSDYQYGPMGTPQGGNYVPIIQAALRWVGIRWNMPEYMISGDSSNGNYASSLVAEAPFTKSCEAKQSQVVKQYRKVWWRVQELAIARGAFRNYGIESISELRRAIELSVTPPEVAVRNRLEESQIRVAEHTAGVLSAETWAEETGRDYEKEKQRGASKQTLTTPGEASPLDLAESWNRFYP